MILATVHVSRGGETRSGPKGRDMKVFLVDRVRLVWFAFSKAKNRKGETGLSMLAGIVVLMAM
jgi:hypothetical protein